MQLSSRKVGLINYREITSDLSLIPKEDYLKVASMILKLDPQDRRDDEIQALQKLTEELQFFKSINSKKVNIRNKLHYKICSKMKYESSQKGQAIIEYEIKAERGQQQHGKMFFIWKRRKQRAKADKFFVLLKGSVIVYLTKSAEILQSEIQEEMRYLEERNIPPIYLTQKDQKRANSISSNHSQSPTNKISFFRQNSILNLQGGQNSPLTRVNSSFQQDSALSKKKSILRSQNESPLNIKFNGQETSELKENLKINLNTPSNSAQLKGRNSIQIFESININTNDLSQKKTNGEILNDGNEDQANKTPKKTSQQRFQRMINLIRQRGSPLDNSSQINERLNEGTPNSGSQQEDTSNDNNQQNLMQQTHKSSMFSKFINNNANNFTSQIAQNQQISEMNLFSQPRIIKQQSISKGLSLHTEDQANIEQEEEQNENQLHLNLIRKRFCEKYLFSKIFGSLNAEHILCPEKLIHFPSFVFKYYYQRTLNQGSTFGELGLLDGKPRSAYILCAEDCEFGIMEKEDYQQLLGSIHRRELERKFNFLKDHMLPELTNQALKKIFYNFQKIKVQKNEYIFKQGTISDGIYLIKKGDVKLEKTLVYQEQVTNEVENGIQMMRKIQNTKKNTPFATLSSGEYFGEEFLIFDFKSKHYRSYSAIASSMKTSLYFMQSSTFTVFLKQFPELFMAFKKTVTFKIERRQEYMENIEQNYKETMKQKEAVNNQRQSDLKMIQSLQSQKSYSDLSCLSPMAQQASPMNKRTSNQISLMKQFSYQSSIQPFESPKTAQFDNRINTNIDRKNLLAYCSPSIRLQSTNNSIADFDNLVYSSKSIVIQNTQPQLKFKLIQNKSQEFHKLSTLQQIDQKQMNEEEGISSQQKVDCQSYPQTKLIKLVSTQNSIQMPEKLILQQNIQNNNQMLIESNASSIQKSNNQSPAQNIKLKLMSEICNNNEQKNMQKQCENKIIRNNQHCKTLSGIVEQSNILQEQLNNFIYQRGKHKSQTAIVSQQHQEQENPVINQKQQQSLLQVIRQHDFQELEELEDLLDVQYFQTKYNPDKLEELFLQVEKLKAEQKGGGNPLIENKLEFLYNRNVKEAKMRINLIKQKIQNTFRKDLSHENMSYQNNRKNIYSNSPNKYVDKITKLSQRYLNKQDQYDKILRNKLISNLNTNNSIQQENLIASQEINSPAKQIPKILVNNSDDALKKSSSLESKFNIQYDKSHIGSYNSHNNLELSSQLQRNSIKSEQQDPFQILPKPVSPFNEKINQRSIPVINYEESNRTNSAPFKNSQLSPLKTSPNSPKLRPKSRNKSALIHLKLNPPSQSSQFFNFNIRNYKSQRQSLDLNVDAEMFQQFQNENANQLISNDQNQLSLTKTQNSNNYEQQIQSTLENYKFNSESNMQQLTMPSSVFVTPDITIRKNKNLIKIPKEIQKMLVIKSQSNLTSITSSPKFKERIPQKNNTSDIQPLSSYGQQKTEDMKQSYFFKHRKTQSHLLFDIAPSSLNQKAPFLQQNSSVSPVKKIQNQDKLINNISIQNVYQNLPKTTQSMSNFNEIKRSGNLQVNLHPSQKLNDNKALQKSNSSKQIQANQKNNKLKDIIPNSSTTNYQINQIQQNTHPHLFQQSQNGINTKYTELSNNLSMVNHTQIELIKSNSRLMQRKIHNPLQIFKGSKTNSSISIKAFLDSTNSPLCTNNPTLKQNFLLEQNQQ